jgi:hypothetical protein
MADPRRAPVGLGRLFGIQQVPQYYPPRCSMVRVSDPGWPPRGSRGTAVNRIMFFALPSLIIYASVTKIKKRMPQVFEQL